jgi:hypothetical protein
MESMLPVTAYYRVSNGISAPMLYEQQTNGYLRLPGL